MQLDIIPRGYETTTRVRNQVEECVAKLEKYGDFNAIRVTLTSEGKDYVAEYHLHAWGKEFHSKTSSDDMLSSVEKASKSLEEQLRRSKDKRKDAKKVRFDQPGLTSAAALEAQNQKDFDPDEE